MVGFYIGRYEARTTNKRDNNTSNDNTISDSNLTVLTEKPDEYVYNFVTQPQAANLSQNMYTTAISSFESDLINSYAWDTAILFLQSFGESEYSTKNVSIASGFAPRGTNKLEKSNQDIVCNVYDMASNCYEWSTETWKASKTEGAQRGGWFGEGGLYSGARKNGLGVWEDTGSLCTFRPILYIK